MLALELLHRFGERLVVGLVAVARDSEAVAQRRHAGIPHAGLEHRPSADACGPRVAVAGSRFAELGAQRPVARMRRIVRAERLAGIGRRGHPGQDFGGLREHLLVKDVGTDARIMHAAGLGMARVGQHRIGESQLGIGKRLGPVGRRLEIGRRIVARIQSVAVRGLESGNPIADPYRRIAAPGIKGVDRRPLFLAIQDAFAFAGQQFAQLLRNRVIGGRKIDGDGGLGRFFGRRRRRRVARRRGRNRRGRCGRGGGSGRIRGGGCRAGRLCADRRTGLGGCRGRFGCADGGRRYCADGGRLGHGQSADVRKGRRRHIGRFGERHERLDRLEVRGGTFGLGTEIPSGQHNDLNEAKRRAGQHAIQPQPAHRAIPCSRATPPRTPGRGRGPARASPT